MNTLALLLVDWFRRSKNDLDGGRRYIIILSDRVGKLSEEELEELLERINGLSEAQTEINALLDDVRRAHGGELL